MSLKTAKSIIRFLLISCVAAAVVGVVLASQKSPDAAYVALVALALFVLAIIFLRAFCKCPFCGERISRGLYTVTHCPHCRRDLVTGVKKKGKGGKKVKHH